MSFTKLVKSTDKSPFAQYLFILITFNYLLYCLKFTEYCQNMTINGFHHFTHISIPGKSSDSQENFFSKIQMDRLMCF